MTMQFEFVSAVIYAPRFFFFGGQIVAEQDETVVVPATEPPLDDGTLDPGDFFDTGGRVIQYEGFYTQGGDTYLVFTESSQGLTVVLSQTASSSSPGYPNNVGSLPNLTNESFEFIQEETPFEGVTEGDDVITGTSGPDEIAALTGDDDITGLGGADVIEGNRNDDTIDGGGGSDTVLGGSGDDDLSGGSGTDRLSGNDGEDDISGGNGNDVLFGNDGRDTLDGGNGNDGLNGGNGFDVLTDGDGRDTMTGGNGADVFELVTDTRIDKITDFEDGTDLIRLTGVTFDDLEFIEMSNGTIRILYADDELRVLEDGGPLAISDFTEADFLFV